MTPKSRKQSKWDKVAGGKRRVVYRFAGRLCSNESSAHPFSLVIDKNIMNNSPQPKENARVLRFAGGCNFRDLGGYRTKDGHTLRWGRVYRTGVLSYFCDSDHAPLSELGVSAICDLRRLEEREREPTRWPDAKTQLVTWDDGDAAPTIRTIATNHPYDAKGMHGAMIDLYRALPNWMAPRLRGMFELIARNDGAVLVHCAAGKDRTGVAIALLLAVLDVPHEVIFEDYLLTNTAGDFVEFILANQNAHLGIAPTNNPLMTLPEDIRRVLFAAHSDYLQAAFETIAKEYGGLLEFAERAAGVNAEMRRKIRLAMIASS
jgi:protein-tyrosine phosphatase